MGRNRRKGRRRGARQDGDGGGAGRSGDGARSHFTPEQRREAVEKFHAAGLTQAAFARQWGMSPFTLGLWLRKHAAEGPKGLERMAAGPARRRGRPPLSGPVREEIATVARRFPDFGLKKIRNWIRRFSGLSASTSTVRKVKRAEGLPSPSPAPKPKRKPAPPRRFERSRPGELWQSDITYLDVPWRKGPLYLIAFLDDHSRFVVGHGLFTHQRQDIAIDVFQEACARYGKPRECLTDQGRQYFAWRGKNGFQKMLAKEGVAHVVARAHHPQTVGKTERFWETLKGELWDRVHPKDLEEARARVTHFVAHHNFQRPHQSLDGLVPADRFFGAAEEVRKAVEGAISRNELRLALGETPRKPVYLVGQIDGKTVSVHGEAGRLVVQTPDGERQEIEAKDLGAHPSQKEHDDGQDRDDSDDGDGGDADGDDTPGPADGGGAPAPGPGGGGPAPAADGAQADEVRRAAEVPGAGARALEGSEPAGAGEGARDGDGRAAGVAGQGDA